MGEECLTCTPADGVQEAAWTREHGASGRLCRSDRWWARLAARLCEASAGFLTRTDGADSQTEGIDLARGSVALNHGQMVVADAAARHVHAAGRPLLLADTRRTWSRPGTTPALASVRSVLAVPIGCGPPGCRCTVGVLDSSPRCWNPGDLSTLERLAAAHGCARADELSLLESMFRQ